MNERQSTDGKNTAMATERGSGDWRRLPFSMAVEINPRRAVARGTPAPFVDMASLPAETRHVRSSRVKPVGPGGSRFSNGDTLFARITPCTENGKTGLVSCLLQGEIATGSTEFIVLGPRPEVTLPEYVYYMAKNQAFRSYAISRMTGTSGRQRVPTSVFDDYEVRIPPVTEQRTIAAVLSSVDDAIEKTQAVIDQVQIVKRGVMQGLFTRGLPGRHIRFKKTEIGELPEEWMAMTLADAAAVVGGGTPSRNQPTYWNGDVPWATPTDVTGLDGRIISETATSITEAGLASSSATLLPPNSLLMTTRATIGACAINRVAMATNQGFQSLVPKRNVEVGFLYYLMQHHARRLQRLAAGSTFLEVSNRTVRGFRVYLPHRSEQRKIAVVLSSMDDAIEESRLSLDRLQAVKRSLMSALLTGEVRVSMDTEAA